MVIKRLLLILILFGYGSSAIATGTEETQTDWLPTCTITIINIGDETLFMSVGVSFTGKNIVDGNSRIDYGSSTWTTVEGGKQVELKLNKPKIVSDIAPILTQDAAAQVCAGAMCQYGNRYYHDIDCASIGTDHYINVPDTTFVVGRKKHNVTAHKTAALDSTTSNVNTGTFRTTFSSSM